MDTIIKVKCIDQTLTLINSPVIASGGLNENKLECEFCEKWDGFSKTAVFYQDKKNVYYSVLDENDTCIIPKEATASKGTMCFGIFGSKGDATRTSEILRYKIDEGAITEDLKPSDPTPDIYEQILAKLQEIREAEATFETDITKQQTDFEEAQTKRQSEYETAQTDRQEAFETAQTNRQTTYETNLTKKEGDFETTINDMIVGKVVLPNSENLIANGRLELGNNYNFTNIGKFVGDENYNCGGAIKITKSGYTLLITSEKIFVDPNNKYQLDYYFKCNNSSAKHYDIIIPYDIDDNLVDSNNILWVAGSTTKLAKDLNNGDTVVYLEDVSGFDGNGKVKGLIFWNYKNSYGYQYEKETYSRNVFRDIWADSSSIDTTNNTITLKSAWAGGNIPQGTDVSQNNSGSNYIYFHYGFANNGEWAHMQGTLKGIVANEANNCFRHGTAYVKIGFYQNIDQLENVESYVSNICFRRIEEDATTSTAGLMSASDKSKLVGIATGANKTVVSDSLTDTSTTNALSAKQGKVLNDAISNEASARSSADSTLQTNINTINDNLVNNYATKTYVSEQITEQIGNAINSNY